MQHADRDKLKAVCEREASVVLCVLFGSEVSGNYGPERDVDMALMTTGTLDLEEQTALYGKLADCCSAELDIVWLSHDSDPSLAREILFSAELVFERSPGLFEDEVSLAARRYMDNQWLIRRRKEQNDERIKELTSHVS